MSATRSACTGCSSPPACCRRRPSGSTPAASYGPTRSGSASSGSTSTRRRSASSSATHDGDGDASAPRCSTSSRAAARCRTRSPGPAACSPARSPRSAPTPPLGLEVGDRVATLVSLTLTPLVITDDLARWDGAPEQVPCRRVRDPVRPLDRRGDPDDLPTRAGPGRDGRLRRTGPDRARRRGGYVDRGVTPTSRHRGSRASPARCRWPPPRGPAPAAPSASSRSSARPTCWRRQGSPTWSRSPTPATRSRSRPPSSGAGGPADVTVVCVDVPGCEGGAILSTADGGTVIFFSMATSFSAAALGAEGLAADVTMLVGNGYVPGHADYALDLLRGRAGRAAPSSSRLGAEDDQVDADRPAPRWHVQHARATPHATALCVEDGRSSGSATTTPAGPLRRHADRVVELDGRLVTPGVRRRPRAPRADRLRAASASTWPASTALPRRSTRSRRSPDHARPPVVFGHGWDETGLARAARLHPRGAGPRRRRPVAYLSRVDAHSAVVSSAFLDAAPSIGARRGLRRDGLVARDAPPRRPGPSLATCAPAAREDAILRAPARTPPRTGSASVHELGAPHICPGRDFACSAAHRPSTPLPESSATGASSAPSTPAGRVRLRRASPATSASTARSGHGPSALHAPYADAGRPPATPTSTPDRSPSTSSPAPSRAPGGLPRHRRPRHRRDVAGFERAADKLGAAAIVRARHRLEHVEMADAAADRRRWRGSASSRASSRCSTRSGAATTCLRRAPRRRAARRDEPVRLMHRAGVALAFGSTPRSRRSTPGRRPRGRLPPRRGRADTVRAAFDAHTRGGRRARARRGRRTSRSAPRVEHRRLGRARRRSDTATGPPTARPDPPTVELPACVATLDRQRRTAFNKTGALRIERRARPRPGPP